MAFYLADAMEDIERARQTFAQTEGETERVVAGYLESALEEISMTLSIDKQTVEPLSEEEVYESSDEMSAENVRDDHYNAAIGT